MGMRFRKSIKLAPGVKLNVGKKSMGVSIGSKYGGVSVNSKTGVRGRVSVPGTGISFTETAHSKKKETSAALISDIEPCSTVYDERVVRSLNDAAFQDYLLGFSAYTNNLSVDAMRENGAGRQLNLLMSELERRIDLMEWDNEKIKSLNNLDLRNYSRKYIDYGSFYLSLVESMLKSNGEDHFIFSSKSDKEIHSSLHEIKENMSFLSTEMERRKSNGYGNIKILSSLQFLIFSLIVPIAGLVLIFFNYTVPGIVAFGIGLVLLLISYFNQ